MAHGPELKRTITLPSLTLYGLGTMIGAGFYALLGKVAAAAGGLAPLAFLAAAVTAAFAVLTYSELVTRFPRSGGVAVYAHRAFGSPRFAAVVGWATMLTGMVSAAALAHAFNGYLAEFVNVQDWLVLVVFTLTLGLVTGWGIAQSVTIAVVITVVEVAGLLLVAAVVLHSAEWQGVAVERLLPSSAADAGVVLIGGFLSLYAFIGFEDVVNVAEEVREPRRAMPRALVLALLATTLLYVSVSVIAVLAVPMEILKASEAPLADVVRGRGTGWSVVVGMVGLLAGINGALVQIVMASRVLYGMAADGTGPRFFDEVNAVTRTPLRATVLVTLLVMLLALTLELVTLAKVTSLIVLLIFAIMHVALLRVKRREAPPPGATVIPGWAPWAGMATIALLLAAQGIAWVL